MILGIVSKPKSRLNVRLVVFGFFVIVASILWYLNKLTYEYTTDITYPLRIENIPAGKVPIGELPTSITLQIRDFGYSLIRLKMGAAFSPISIKLDEVNPTRLAKSETKHFVLTARARNSIANQMKEMIQLGRITPDTLFFEFTTMAQKRVKVSPEVSFTLERQYMQSGPITVKPDSISISGPQALLDSIKVLYTHNLKLENLSHNITQTILLKEHSQVAFSHRKVNVTIPVGKFTEAQFSQRIAVRNLPDSVRLILIPTAVTVKCNVLIERYKGLLEGSILEPYVDFNELDMQSSKKLKIHIQSKQHIIDVIDFDPNYVEYIIERI